MTKNSSWLEKRVIKNVLRAQLSWNWGKKNNSAFLKTNSLTKLGITDVKIYEIMHLSILSPKKSFKKILYFYYEMLVSYIVMS